MQSTTNNNNNNIFFNNVNNPTTHNNNNTTNNNNIFTTQIKQSTSTIIAKRQQFRAQIRKQHIDNLLAVRRRQLIQSHLQQQQKQRITDYIQQLLSHMKELKSIEEYQDIIKRIWQQINREDINFKSIIVPFASQLLKCFILCPRYRYSVNILYKILRYCYEETFNLDDSKYYVLYSDCAYDAKLQRKELTEYQQAMLILMEMIDELIDSLGERKAFSKDGIVAYVSMMSQQSMCSQFQPQSQPYYHQQQQHQLQQNITHQQQLQHQVRQTLKHNNKIQTRLKSYTLCLKQLILNMNCFIMRYQFVQKYIIKWCYKLLIQYKFQQSTIIYYLYMIIRQVVPFKTLACYGNSKYQNQNQIMKNNNTISQQQYQIQTNIIQQLFSQCLPQTTQVTRNKLPYLTVAFLKEIFSFKQIRLQKVIQYLQPLCYMVRVVLNHRKYFTSLMVDKMFELLTTIIIRFKQEMINADTKEEDIKLLQSVNLYQVLQQMQFISTFTLYLKQQNQSACLPIYKLLSQLIEYCLVFRYQLTFLINISQLLVNICHKLDSQNYQLLAVNIKTIDIICEYATRQNRREFFVSMVNYGVDQRLQHLVYHKNQVIRQTAIKIQQLYFTEDQVYNYTQLESQLQRYDDNHYQDQDWM